MLNTNSMLTRHSVAHALDLKKTTTTTTTTNKNQNKTKETKKTYLVLLTSIDTHPKEKE